MTKKKHPSHEVEFFESTFPGKLVGKEVLDKDSRRIGIIKSIRIEHLPWKISLMIKGINLEIPVDLSEVENIGTIVQLKSIITAMPEIDENEMIRLKNEIRYELRKIIRNPIL